MNETLDTVLTTLHIVCGFTALVTGVVAIIATKGKLLHNRSGLLYFYSMLGVVVTALIISILKDNQFLLHLGFFTMYLIYSGYRSITHKSLVPSPLDWGIWLIGAVNGLWMIFTLDMILIVFGVISIINVSNDGKLFYQLYKNRPLPKMAWLRRHVGMMLGSYIATITAFVVVNVDYKPLPWLPWLLPTIVIVPVLIYWTRRISQGKMKLRD